MQNVFLMTSKGYSEKQAGIMFFVFGMSQFLAQTPAGYLMDYSDKKVLLLGGAAVGTTLLTLATAIFAQDAGANLGFMIFLKFLQGAITALIPPGLNSITQGIVGSVGMTSQVSMNEMMNHLGTAIIILTGSFLAFFLYPNIGLLFAVSPIACVGVVYYMAQIRPGDIDHNAARGLTTESVTTSKTESFDETSKKNYHPPNPSPQNTSKGPIQVKPSFNMGFGSNSGEDSSSISQSSNTGPQADTPLSILRDPTLMVFVIICFSFHLSNGTVLPLVMQALALGEGKSGILMSGMCIIIAQACMVVSAHVCGKYSGMYGRKGLFLVGILSVPLRCAILSFLLYIKENGASADAAEYYVNNADDAYYGDRKLQYYDDAVGDDAAAASSSSGIIDLLILSTQIFDGVGAGIFGTMYVLVTSDISGGTGRFSLTLGLTTAAMSIGGTVSGYLGQALAEDIGYRQAFGILGCMALLPAALYLFCMPETLSDKEAQKANAEKNGMTGISEDGESETTGIYGRFA